MRLPEEFLKKMRALMSEEEYSAFVESYNKSRCYGLRVNTLKISIAEFMEMSPFNLEPVPWVEDGFYYSGEENPGKHLYYHAGLYYIQEPSAMLPGKVMDAKPGEYILDLCAAPGGKTVQIAAGMRGKGLLVANDISASRVKALIKNIELCGIKNAIVTSEPAERLVSRFENFFDKILVDAPCSGEGMFRKDRDAVKTWGRYKSERYALMQRNILENADKMLKHGGYMVYSTCTFAPEENEKVIGSFLDAHTEYELVDIPKVDGMEPGRPDWAEGKIELEKTVRLWPHRVKGEGHFVALLRKKGEVSCRSTDNSGNNREKSEIPRSFYEFVKENLNTDIDGYFFIKGSNLYCLPVEPPDLSGIRVAKFGWYLGEFHNQKFRPSHSMVVALKKNDVKRIVDLSSKSTEVYRYLKGETLMVKEGKKGFVAVCVDGYTLGWAKQMGTMLKNLYPKGWRKLN